MTHFCCSCRILSEVQDIMCLLRAAQMEGVGGSSGEMLYPARFHYHHDGTLGKKLWQLNVSDVDLQ